jgi:SPP1 family predicted phage head-tail adaptor
MAGRKIVVGQMDQRVSIQRKTRVADGLGGFTITETTIATVWARVETERGQERVIADQQRGVVGYRLTSRNQGSWSGVTTGDVLVLGSVRLNVRSAPLAGREAYRLIEAEAEVVT